MKKNVLQTIIICFVTLVSFAQNCEYEEYYQIVESAKNYSSKQKYKDANKEFKHAFSKVEFPLGHDLSFALIAANKSKDDNWAGIVAKKLAKGGIPLRYFAKYKREKWYKKFNLEFENYSNHYQDNLNPQLRVKLLSLLKKDREFNSEYHKWRAHKIEMTLDELIDSASEILEEFKNLVEIYGFPTEQKMGYNYVRSKNMIESYPIIVLIIHIYQRGVLLFENEIQKIICEGGLEPQWGDTLKEVHGYGNSTGVEQEMKARFERFRGQK